MHVLYNIICLANYTNLIFELCHSIPICAAGKQVIHPTQVLPAHESFAPSQAKAQWAKELIAAFEEHKQKGKVRSSLVQSLL